MYRNLQMVCRVREAIVLKRSLRFKFFHLMGRGPHLIQKLRDAFSVPNILDYPKKCL